LYFAYYSVEGLASDAIAHFPGSTEAATNLDASTSYGTYFVVPTSQLFRPRNWIHLRTRLIYLANLILPPILTNAARKLARLLR
jgi:hypothetical protein